MWRIFLNFVYFFIKLFLAFLAWVGDQNQKEILWVLWKSCSLYRLIEFKQWKVIGWSSETVCLHNFSRKLCISEAIMQKRRNKYLSKFLVNKQLILLLSKDRIYPTTFISIKVVDISRIFRIRQNVFQVWKISFWNCTQTALKLQLLKYILALPMVQCLLEI